MDNEARYDDFQKEKLAQELRFMASRRFAFNVENVLCALDLHSHSDEWYWNRLADLIEPNRAATASAHPWPPEPTTPFSVQNQSI